MNSEQLLEVATTMAGTIPTANVLAQELPALDSVFDADVGDDYIGFKNFARSDDELNNQSEFGIRLHIQQMLANRSSELQSMRCKLLQHQQFNSELERQMFGVESILRIVKKSLNQIEEQIQRKFEEVKAISNLLLHSLNVDIGTTEYSALFGDIGRSNAEASVRFERLDRLEEPAYPRPMKIEGLDYIQEQELLSRRFRAANPSERPYQVAEFSFLSKNQKRKFRRHSKRVPKARKPKKAAEPIPCVYIPPTAVPQTVTYRRKTISEFRSQHAAIDNELGSCGLSFSTYPPMKRIRRMTVCLSSALNNHDPHPLDEVYQKPRNRLFVRAPTAEQYELNRILAERNATSDAAGMEDV